MENNTSIDDEYHTRFYDERRVGFIIICIVNAPFSITAVLGNALIIFSIWNCPTLHSPSSLILFCLALSDFGVGLFVQPLYIIYQTFYLKKHWQTWIVAMKAFNVVANFFSGLSFLTTTAVSVDRFLAIHLHLRYQQLVTVRGTVQFLPILFLVAAFSASILLWRSNITFIIALALIVVCLFISTLAYIRIYQVVRSHRKKIQDQSRNPPTNNCRENTLNTARQIRTAVGVFYVCIIHFFCYLPYFVFLILRDAYRVNTCTVLAVESAQILIFLNSSLNPLVFCWRLREFRVAMNQTLVAFGCRFSNNENSQSRSIYMQRFSSRRDPDSTSP